MAVWRPPQWSQQQQVFVSYTSSGGTQTSNAQQLPGTTSVAAASSGQSTTLYFDGYFSTDHYLSRRYTQLPVQNNTSISDHSFNLQDRVVMGVGFSDAMQSYDNGQYSSSVDAFTQFVALKEQGKNVKLSTRLKQYGVMGIESIRAADTLETACGVKFVITFIQIIMATTNTTNVQSSRPDSSQQTPTGTEQSVSVPLSIGASNSTLTNAATPPSAPNVPNPNPNWSSDPVGAQP